MKLCPIMTMIILGSSGVACFAAAGDKALQPALGSIRSEDLLKHIRVLASDEFEGRGPGSKGEKLTLNYLVEQFTRLGLQPGHPDGGWFQDVPLAGVKSDAATALTVKGKTTDLIFPQDCVVWSSRIASDIVVEQSDLVFVGYGVDAPEYGWDDYKGIDVRGKTLVMLVNDPPLPDPDDPAKLDENRFKGRAMTYYGRWTYKYEIAARKGAAAAFVIHETGPAGYPYFVVINSWGRENFGLKSADGNRDELAVAAWMSFGRAQSMFRDLGMEFEEVKRGALSQDFKPIPLEAKVTFKVHNTIREVQSRNVIARLPGSDPKLRNQYVTYTAHWDHIGRNDQLNGDQIFNGALDNASGTAGLLELAEAFQELEIPPKRSLLFLSVTAEEQGLLGAKFYAENPLYPLTQTLANINMDGLNPWGRKTDVGIIGYGNSTLEDLFILSAKSRGMVVEPEPAPEKGYFYRSDHFEFAKQGVPAFYISSEGNDYIGKPPDYGKTKREEYVEKDYHKVSDEIKPDWDFAGAVEDLQMLFEVGYEVAQGDDWPEWKPGSEFKALREKMLKKPSP